MGFGEPRPQGQWSLRQVWRCEQEVSLIWCATTALAGGILPSFPAHFAKSICIPRAQ